MNRRRLLSFFVLSWLLIPAPLSAGGAILVDKEGSGAAVLWKDGIVRYNLENATEARLGKLSNEQAAQLVRELMGAWAGVTLNGIRTTAPSFREGAGLGSVDSSNFGQHFAYCPPRKECPNESAPFNVGSSRSGQSPILFDDDGSMTDAIHGVGASKSILGFAGPRVVDRVGGVLYIMEGQAILNGRFIDGVRNDSNPETSIEDFKGAIIHEIGHFMGLDHSQVNLSSAIKNLSGDASEEEAIPTMFPLFVNGKAQLLLHFDDKVAASLLYPSAAFLDSFCRIEGKVFEADGRTGLQGVNVVVRNPEDPLAEATSFVSGAFYKGGAEGCNAKVGDYLLSGLTPGKGYSLSIERLSPSFTGGSSVEPCDPPQRGFQERTIPGLFSCATGGSIITSNAQATTKVVTTKTTTRQDPSPASDTGGGCSLMPR